jgi:hypothetical protein
MKGTCSICGLYTDLTFEHIPPKSAFNNSPVMILGGKEAILHKPDEIFHGKILQKGFGAYSLCAKCNNLTGAWYVNHFKDWCHHGIDILKRTNGKPGLVYLHYLIPLRIIKQIFTIFFTVNKNNLHSKHPYLVDFILNKEKKYLPPEYRIFCYYNWEGGTRSVGISGIGHANGKPPTILSEFSFTPYGYVFCINSDAPNPDLFEITHFANYGYDEVKVMAMDLKVLPTFLAYPGDYRTKEQIYETIRQSKLLPRP